MKEVFNTTGSSRIEKVIFDLDNRDIIITFKGNKVYKYVSVSEFDFNTFKDDIENGLSVGKSFERRIRNKYAGQKL
jgi:hypothetical protein